MEQYSVFWFRRDLRLNDNKGLYHALSKSNRVIPLFIFDTTITDGLPANDARVEFIHKTLYDIHKMLHKRNKTLLVLKGKPLDVFNKLPEDYPIESVYTNSDHEPYGINRDEKIKELLNSKGVGYYASLDHLLFDKNEVLKGDGSPYHVFTPYGKKCRELLRKDHFRYHQSEKLIKNMTSLPHIHFPELKEVGFTPSGISFPSNEGKDDIIDRYHKTRDYPSHEGTTRLGIHLRFGTISIRSLAKKSFEKNEVFLNELLWREFYAMILWHYPHIVDKSFKPRYDRIPWHNNEEEFEKWKEGKTGYPMVDAGMRELVQSGYMHNRVRMITASFLTKHLLIDWRWGEAWFAEKLLDFELSNNNGGWQWSAGSGCDAAPYFRIFNPTEQQKKFDPKGEYIGRWLPEYTTKQYAPPIIEHKYARERCLKVFKTALSS